MKKPIPPLDLLWFVMETQASPTHVGALLLFEKPAGRPGVVREIVEAYRAMEAAAPFNYVPELASAGRPYFREAEKLDPHYHIQHVSLPEGATYDDLLRLVTDLHEPMLDRHRPLFRDWFIDGVPGNRFALYLKIHHAIIDGVSGLRRIHESMSTDPKHRISKSAFAADAPLPRARPPKALVDRLAELGITATRQTRAIRDVSIGALKKGLATLLGEDPVGSQPFTAVPGPMNEPPTPARSLATLTLPLDEMRQVAKHFEVTLNDLSVTLVDAGLHRYLRRTGRPFPHRIVAMCPMSLRAEGDTETGTKASAMFVHLGAPDAPAALRVSQVGAAMNAAKEELRAMSKDAATVYAVTMLGVAELTSSPIVDRVARPLANIVISNVPGGRERLYLNGAPLEGIFPVSAVAASVGLNATLTSYHDRMDFGFVGIGSTMYDLPLLADQVQAAFDELKAATRKRRAVKPGSGRAPARGRRRAAGSRRST